MRNVYMQDYGSRGGVGRSSYPYTERQRKRRMAVLKTFCFVVLLIMAIVFLAIVLTDPGHY